MRGTSLALGAAALLMMAGCATTGGDQMANSVYATHRIVQKLDTDLAARVDKLNQTAADLSAKVDASDQATRQLQSMMEENQAKLNALQKNLDRFSQAMYRQLGLSPGTTGGVQVGPSSIEPPTGETPTTPAVPGEAAVPAFPGGTAAPVPAPMTAPAESPASDLSGNATADYKKAAESYMNDNFQEALTLYSQFLEKYPDSDLASLAQFWKASSYQKMGQWEQAVREYDTARQSYPMSKKTPLAMYNQAECYLRLGQQQRAIDLLKDVTTNPRYSTDATVEMARNKLKELQGQ
ncbi:MAG: tetratricopeptide repeat protein [Candidatus Hydrogenedentes bacterium]|nr:tetratricopeptide repeat protein [Candidatus Hydrogenedentota bacterium]